jgi:hypothetical protein
MYAGYCNQLFSFLFRFNAKAISTVGYAVKKIIHPDDDIRLYRCASLHSAKVIGVLSPVGIHLMSAEGLLL